MWPLEPEEARPGQYEAIWSHRKLFTTKANVEETGNGTSQLGQPKSGTLDTSANGAAPQRNNGGPPEDKLAKLNGTWEVIALIDNGEQVPEAKIKGFRFVFHKETLQWISPDGKKEDEFRVRLDSHQEPLAIDLVQTPSSA